MRDQFSENIATKLSHYVYRLIDPRNGSTFYVGRGQGNRVFAHAAGNRITDTGEDDEALKFRTIRAIRNAGFDVAHVIHRHGMNEAAAKEVEAALIDVYPGLTNIVGGYDAGRGVMHAREIVALYEAPLAMPRHKLILINVNRSSDDEDLLQAVRYAWRIKPEKARQADYVLAVRKGMIIGAFKATEWLAATAENFPSFVRAGYGPREGRYGFNGSVAPTEIRELYEQKRVPDEQRKRGAANPVRYWNM